MNIANTVISQENSSLASMGTDQLLDLFSLDSSSESKKNKSATAAAASSPAEPTEEKRGSMKSVLENMGELWDERQYEDEYNLETFMQSLRKK